MCSTGGKKFRIFSDPNLQSTNGWPDSSMPFSSELMPMAYREYKAYRKPIQRSDGTWFSSYLFCAAFLVARGNEIIGIEPTNQGGRWAFAIEPHDGFDDDLRA